MKSHRSLFVAMLLSLTLLPVEAETETWTRKDGKSASLKLVGASGEGDDLVGHFVLPNGQKYQIKASELTEADAKRLAEAKAKGLTEGAPSDGGACVYDEFFRDGLVKLDSGRMESHRLDKNPNKYFAFYYTASWCAPCKEFMPALKDFDQKSGSSNDYQIIVVSRDDSAGDMAQYAKASSINWPHIKSSKRKAFEKQFPHPDGSIPNLVITDLQGKVLASAFHEGRYYGARYGLLQLHSLLTGQPMPKVNVK